MKKLVLDLDETLVFSTLESTGPDSVPLTADGTSFYTTLRPGVRPFLEYVRSRFECYIWSTGIQAYLESVWDYIGVDGFTLWGREYCRRIDAPHGVEPYEKPLRQITEDLSEIVIADNSPNMFSKCPLNGIHIRTWRGDMNDTELVHLQVYLDWLRKQPSMQRDHASWRIETLCIRSK